MKLNLGKNKLNIRKVDGFWNRFKMLKFDLQPLKEGILLENRKFLSTYFFCQKVDIVMTDSDYNILYMYKKLKSEKRIFYKRRVHNTYILPLGSCDFLEIGQKLRIVSDKKKNT
ncbi:MAG: hypothetical protein HFJ12_07090 [Bacilli bacterium]|nr:hypothetical protein [Bacilli bacterium]